MRRIHADLMLLLVALIWGLAFIFQKTAMDHIGPMLFVALRATIAAVVLVPFVLHENARVKESIGGGFYKICLSAGLAFFLGGYLQQEGLVTASVTNTGFLTALYVVITPFLAWGASGKVPTGVVWFAAGLSFIGTWLLGGGGKLESLGWGDFLVIASAFFWAAHVVIIGRSSAHNRPITFTAVQFAVVAMIALPSAFATETVSFEMIQNAAFELAFVGILSSGLTFTLLAVALRYTNPAEAAIVVSVEQVFAAIFAAILLSERLLPIGYAGAVLIVIATMMIQIVPLWQKHQLKRAAAKTKQASDR